MLINIEDLRLIEPKIFLAPFLDVIRSEETTGQITSLSLSALNKFLSYGLIGKNVYFCFKFIMNSSKFIKISTDPTHSAIAATVDSIADAVTHARFVGSDQASDGVVLMKVVQVLRTLILSPEGSALTDESVCEVMLSCIRICFEPRLNELLRRTAEQVLKDIVLLLFMRLPQFAEERVASGFFKKLRMMSSGSMDSTGKRTKSLKHSSQQSHTSKIKVNTTKNLLATPAIQTTEINDANTPKSHIAIDTKVTPNQALLGVPKSILATTPSTPLIGNIVDMQGKFMQTPNTESDGNSNTNSTDGIIEENAENDANANVVEADGDADADIEDAEADSTVDQNVQCEIKNNGNEIENASNSLDANPAKGEDFVNSMGVRFTPQTENGAFLFKIHKNKFFFMSLSIVHFEASICMYTLDDNIVNFDKYFVCASCFQHNLFE